MNFHKALMELSHSPAFINRERNQKLAALTALCARLLNVERVSVWKFPEQRDRIESEWLHTPDGGTGKTTSLYQSSNPDYFSALESERVLSVPNAHEDPRTRAFTADYLAPKGISSMLDAPVFDGARLSGVVCLESITPRTWTLPEISFVIAIADTISLMNTHEAWLDSKQALEYATRYDSLTGLLNISSLRDRINYLVGKLERRGLGSLALIWVDVDRLKSINDGLGAQVGDTVIEEIGQRLKQIKVPGKDLLARIGGDEYALIIRNHTLPDTLENTASKVRHEIGKPIRVNGHSIRVGASVGICHLPGDCKTTEDLLRGAEAAMYNAKHKGRDRACFFDSSIQVSARSRFEMENYLRTAITEQKLEVFYQPIANAAGSSVESVEALVRWQHPERGWLSPIEFLDIARGGGLMYALGECVLRRVCEHWQWARSNQIDVPEVSINLAPEQLLVSELPRLIRTVCAEHNVPVNTLHFEVTEDAIQGDFSAITAILEELVADGAQLSIDDFGTGYSSLSRLKGLPFSRIKIDRSFISNIPDDEDDCAIILSILGLARGLGLSVVAEGVETKAHETWLREQGCDYLQGYLYSKPLPFDQLVERFFASK
ncbi:sensor domain-containing phosphodiesterase [Marinobacter sp. TBZ242]|uniref:Sensor domain-containing phosphodiesterase n=1 Tax=Marinobacter azerbaijanicus TaxID=3050455 RepID=A0ABT7I8A6_9GAMM|nr:sensor domain-containing phosphodiesterase [Marinobacter sp. TBZ242]MDL0430386.1 sensor domain-containing phosphodiesterase [Marinobacter sp. TBZ242]